jgi:two-component system LytT family sensor kinase
MESSPSNSRLPYWPWIAAAWMGIGLIDACETVFPMRAQGMHHAWVSLFATRLLVWLPWALATPLVIQLGRRHPVGRTSGLRSLALHLGAAVTIGMVSAAWDAALTMLLNPWLENPPPTHFVELLFARLFSWELLPSLILYAFVLAVDFTLESQQRITRQQTEEARLSEQLSRAQLEALRRQIEPHFVSNALNAIAALVRDDRDDDAVDMMVALSEFLRRAAEDSNGPHVPLAREVEHVSQYLQIQQWRFADRLHVSLDIPPDLLAAKVPNMILQPLVENAIKHGISKRAHGGHVQVAAERAGDLLNLRVGNDGPSLPADFQIGHTGIGIVNLRDRLRLLYGTGFELSLRNRDAGGVQVSISLPLVGT